MKVFKLLPWLLYLVGSVIMYVYRIVDIEALLCVGYGMQLVGVIILLANICITLINKAKRDP